MNTTIDIDKLLDSTADSIFEKSNLQEVEIDRLLEFTKDW